MGHGRKRFAITYLVHPSSHNTAISAVMICTGKKRRIDGGKTRTKSASTRKPRKYNFARLGLAIFLVWPIRTIMKITWEDLGEHLASFHLDT